MHQTARERIKDTNHPSICRDENHFPIITELESCPVTDTMSVKLGLKGGKWALFTDIRKKKCQKKQQLYDGI